MKKFLSLLMACMMIFGCAAMADAADDVVATVDGEPIYASQVVEEYLYYVDYYAAYGLTDESVLAPLREDIINLYAQDKVIENGIEREQIEMPTEEDVAKKALDEYNGVLFELLSIYAADFYTGEGDVDAAMAALIDTASANEGLTVREVIDCMEDPAKTVMTETADVIEPYMAEMGYSVADYENYWKQTLRTEALYEYAIRDLEITEDDVRAYYDEMIAAEKAMYDAAPGQLEEEVASGSLTGDPMYVPEGYRYVEHILVLMDSVDQNNMYTYMTNVAGYEKSIAGLEGVTPMDQETYEAMESRCSEIRTRITEVDGLLQNEDSDIDALTSEREALEAEYAQLQGQMDADDARLYAFIRGRDENLALIDGVKAKYQAELDAIYARLEAGEDFTALVLELGEDPGMLNTARDAVVPYLIYEGTEGVWEESFAVEAVTLAEGEYSDEPVWTSYGAHIVMYKAAVPAGAVAYEDVRERMTEEYTFTCQSEAYTQMVEGWIADSEIVIYADVLAAAAAAQTEEAAE